jgi:hypothetical protein
LNSKKVQRAQDVGIQWDPSAMVSADDVNFLGEKY